MATTKFGSHGNHIPTACAWSSYVPMRWLDNQKYVYSIKAIDVKIQYKNTQTLHSNTAYHFWSVVITAKEFVKQNTCFSIKPFECSFRVTHTPD